MHLTTLFCQGNQIPSTVPEALVIKCMLSYRNDENYDDLEDCVLLFFLEIRLLIFFLAWGSTQTVQPSNPFGNQQTTSSPFMTNTTTTQPSSPFMTNTNSGQKPQSNPFGQQQQTTPSSPFMTNTQPTQPSPFGQQQQSSSPFMTNTAKPTTSSPFMTNTPSPMANPFATNVNNRASVIMPQVQQVCYCNYSFIFIFTRSFYPVYQFCYIYIMNVGKLLRNNNDDLIFIL
jgi:hypothetical protein